VLIVEDLSTHDVVVIGAERQAEVTLGERCFGADGHLCVGILVRMSIDVALVPNPPSQEQGGVRAPAVNDPANNGIKDQRFAQIARGTIIGLGSTMSMTGIEVSKANIRLGFRVWGATRLIPINKDEKYAEMAALVRQAQETEILKKGATVFYQEGKATFRALSTGKATFQLVDPGKNLPKHQHVFVWLTEVQRYDPPQTWTPVSHETPILVQRAWLKPSIAQLQRLVNGGKSNNITS